MNNILKKKNISKNKNLTQELNLNIKKFETNLFSENKKIFGILIEDCNIIKYFN